LSIFIEIYRFGFFISVSVFLGISTVIEGDFLLY